LRFSGGCALATTLAVGGCGWPGLIAGAATTPTSVDDASTNVAIAGGVAWVARSTRGIERIDLSNGKRSLTAPSAPADRIDDVAVSDGLLFALDASPPGELFVYRIGADGVLAQVASSEVAVGPFSGVAAGGGHVIVSGGTSQLSLRRYGANGTLDQAIVTADVGRGPPDIALGANGALALVSTHVQGPKFGLTVADVSDQPLALHARGYVELAGAGFTPGGFHPANFPLQSAALGDVVLVAHGGGLSVLSAPAGAPPSYLGTTPIGLRATAIAVDEGQRLAFVAGASPRSELLTLDVANPRAPRLLARTALSATGSPSAIALDASHLVVAMQDGGVYIQARPAPPSVASNLETVP
jgi:hypothetical protein